jgi:hypothetical protein
MRVLRILKPQRVALLFNQRLDARLAEREQCGELTFREGALFAGHLQLHNFTLCGHDDVGIDLGTRIFGIVQIQQRQRDRDGLCRV